MSNQPLSEQYRVIAKKWVALDGAARLLESNKSSVLAELINKQGDMPVTHAEKAAKTTPEWTDYIKKMTEARTEANLLKVHLEYIKMKFSEQINHNANVRAEMKL